MQEAMNPQYTQMDPTAFWIVFAVVLAWTLYWKGRAMWLACKKDDKKWFVAILILNTLGILDILYIYVVSKKGKKTELQNTITE